MLKIFPPFVQPVLGGNPRIFRKTLCPPDCQCLGVHPQPRFGPPGCQTWEHTTAWQPLLPGQAGRLWPCPEERHPDPVHHGNSPLHGARALHCGPLGGPEGGDGSPCQCGTQPGHLGLWGGHLLHPYWVLPVGVLHGIGWLLCGVCGLVQSRGKCQDWRGRSVTVEEVYTRGYGYVW